MSSKEFQLAKMRHEGAPALRYYLGEIELNSLLGQEISLSFTGRINCVSCGRKINKTFAQGHCYPCFQKLASCDVCILKPELCHFSKGTCREPEWARSHCFIPHIVYLANTSGLKVGITREHQKLVRWGDQGAVAALPLCRVADRKSAGEIEKFLGQQVSDRTDWRKLITGKLVDLDLKLEAARLIEIFSEAQRACLISPAESELQTFSYPVLAYPEKSVLHDPAKTAVIRGRLEGVRGQYLFIAGKALNIWKYSGYEAVFSADTL